MTNGVEKASGERLRMGVVEGSPTASRRHSRLTVCATEAKSRRVFEHPFGIRHSSFSRGFTLIEIMVVVAIIALILGAGIPSLYGVFHKEGMRKTMNDLIETCQSARAKAIMTGAPAELVIHPREGRCEVGGSGAGRGGYGAWATSAKVEGGRIEALKVNNGKDDYSQADEVHIRFFPNGTSEEMVLLLLTDQNQMRGISLEITTGMASVLTPADIQAFAR